MARSLLGGNQRELARQKNMKKQQSLNKTKGAGDKDNNKNMTVQQRNERDAAALEAKKKKKENNES